MLGYVLGDREVGCGREGTIGVGECEGFDLETVGFVHCCSAYNLTIVDNIDIAYGVLGEADNEG